MPVVYQPPYDILNLVNKTASPVIASSYVPGVCNINSAEAARRRRAGYLGLAAFAVLALALVLFDIPRLVRIILFAPAFLAAIGFLQAHYKFCVGYGAAGVQNATEGDKAAQAIINKSARELDQKRTRKINLQAVAIALLASIVALLAP